MSNNLFIKNIGKEKIEAANKKLLTDELMRLKRERLIGRAKGHVPFAQELLDQLNEAFIFKYACAVPKLECKVEAYGDPVAGELVVAGICMAITADGLRLYAKTKEKDKVPAPKSATDIQRYGGEGLRPCMEIHYTLHLRKTDKDLAAKIKVLAYMLESGPYVEVAPQKVEAL